MSNSMGRREFLAMLAGGAAGVALPGCGSDTEPGRYTEADIAGLDLQRAAERELSGRGAFGPQRYNGYRGLASLPWFELDPDGALRCVADDFPPAIDVHCHFGVSMLLAPDVDLAARTPRVRHLLDCDGSEPGCQLDLDIYINGNFSDADLRALYLGVVAQSVWGSSAAATQTIPNLLAEMDATRVEQALILPIVFGWPFGDDLNERWAAAIAASGHAERLHLGASVHPSDPERLAALERYAAAGARVLKLHPTMQRFYPDDPALMELYAACERLGMVVFFHAGRTGIEPESSHRYAVPRHYQGALESFPRLQFVLGHSGARDAAAMLDLGVRHENVWFDIHGQGVTQLHQMIQRTGGVRMLFGADWPFYHLAATLAKVLIVTEGEPEIRAAILRQNAEQLLGKTPGSAEMLAVSH
jgi:predicted TIM-barrel fold metal-dependent hydrolase